ncbi:MAG TPA: GDSL-type esterase/lipase family protein [Catenuloplanes sp.]|jgi:lysophospholipase L1-like esterase
MAGIRQGSVRLARRVLAGALAAAMATTGCTADRPRAAADGDARRTTDAAARPRSMAALGDSITRAFATCGRGGDCVENSWATGTAPGVDSHWQRLAVGAADGNHNVAVSGARVAGLGAQVQAALRVRPGYVTVLIGANDACAGDEAAMTPVGEFAAAFDAAVDALARGLPDARILVLSIPDLSRLWEVGRDRPEVVRAWESYRICQSMLAAATDRGADAQARRERVRERVIAYNAAMGTACARHPQCRHDRNAVFDYRFDLADVSTVDYWHPSSRGQATLARVGWEAGFWS